MLNLRKLKKSLSGSVLHDGEVLFKSNSVTSVKILHLDEDSIKIGAHVVDKYDNMYSSQIEIDRNDSETIDFECGCNSSCDCKHMAAVLFYLEDGLNEILVDYSKESGLLDGDDSNSRGDGLLKFVREASNKEQQKSEQNVKDELVHEYTSAVEVLSRSPFFAHINDPVVVAHGVEVAVYSNTRNDSNMVEIQISLRMPQRTKFSQVVDLKEFLYSIRDCVPVKFGNNDGVVSYDSFNEVDSESMRMLAEHAVCEHEKQSRSVFLENRIFELMVGKACRSKLANLQTTDRWCNCNYTGEPIPSCFFANGSDTPVMFSKNNAKIYIYVEHISPPLDKILLTPVLSLDGEKVTIDNVKLFASVVPGVLHGSTYYQFDKCIKMQHVLQLPKLREIVIPKPLFGTFLSNSLPKILEFVTLKGDCLATVLSDIPTPQVEPICDLSFLDGELEASLSFKYDGCIIPANGKSPTYESVAAFVNGGSVMARDLSKERHIIDSLFKDFVFDKSQGIFIAKTEKRIIEFMTNVVPKHRDHVRFNCPRNLLDRFIYETPKMSFSLSHSDRVGYYNISMKMQGMMCGLSLNNLRECISSNQSYIRIEPQSSNSSGNGSRIRKCAKVPKILVLDLHETSKMVHALGELCIETLSTQNIERPLWSLASLDERIFKGLGISFSMTDQLLKVRDQMLGNTTIAHSAIPTQIKATLRPYQIEGVRWLESLRAMRLNGILADDMGLGKTLQTIVAITQQLRSSKLPSLVIAPTSLLYNWKEECARFNPSLKTIIIEGTPSSRQQLIAKLSQYDVVITSYSLLQKDIHLYKKSKFAYMVLDEAQNIKNRSTRNAHSVNEITATYKLVLSGTPIENSLSELWSLFNYLMGGFLDTYERFKSKYLSASVPDENFKNLKKKISPFILRRMKENVLEDLPSITENFYYCQLQDEQLNLYMQYAASAKAELTKLVEKDGFDRVHMHVLATLTRLKQICCHPRLVLKEPESEMRSAKYDLMMELLHTLINSDHRVVIFSQYTSMLKIIREDFEKMKIPFSYLDGTSKNRSQIVKEFNANDSIPIFLISLKAGGTGLNLVGANAVILFDEWWNPAVTSQAIDRVYRIGQKKAVSVFKLVTVDTVEEKIIKINNSKKGLVEKVVQKGSGAIQKLTWDEVLELL